MCSFGLCVLFVFLWFGSDCCGFGFFVACNVFIFVVCLCVPESEMVDEDLDHIGAMLGPRVCVCV